MSRLARPAARLADGSAILARAIGRRVTAWVARGRRHDLTGWRAALGCWFRLAVLTLGVYLLWRLVRAMPNLMWVFSGVWVIAAWRAGRNASADVEEADEEAPAPPDAEAVRALLLALMGDGSGVHLRTVLAHLQEHAGWEGRTMADLRARLDRLGIPFDRNVKVAGVPTWGVRRRDLEAPTPVRETDVSSGTELPV
ncbi:hypothetical protein SAMN04490357_1021 [Streptomyces misionensis]|uniref:Uncharacterized protein n=1 Tax=Streptomyces misionensis TaxID=67331 RepID=A0A1H4P8H6_9ACTN|nr:hypothetical protein [Streptomyces misionensis]SEC03730.1 hypothetical protein SAMN04490357_1021 [Streptomyces misionensis]